MTLTQRFKKLSLWNKLGVFGSVASLLGLVVAFESPTIFSSGSSVGQKGNESPITKIHSSTNSTVVNNSTGTVTINLTPDTSGRNVATNPQQGSGKFYISALKVDDKTCSYKLHRFREGVGIFDGRVEFYGTNVPVNLKVTGNVSRSVVLYGKLGRQRSVPYGSTYASRHVVEDSSQTVRIPDAPSIELNADSCWYPATRERLIKDVSLAMMLGNNIPDDWESLIDFSVAAFGSRFCSLDEFRDAMLRCRAELNNELFLFLPLAELTPQDVPIAIDEAPDACGRPVAPVLNVTFTNDTDLQQIVSSATFTIFSALAFKSVNESEIIKPLAVVDLPFMIERPDNPAEDFPVIKIAAHDSAAVSIRLIPQRSPNSRYDHNYGYAAIAQMEFRTNHGIVATDKMIVYFEH